MPGSLTASERSAGRRRPMTEWNSSRRERLTTSNSPATATVTASTVGHIEGVVGSIPRSARTLFCHPTCCHADEPTATTTSPPTTHFRAVATRPDGLGMPRYRHRAAPPAPSP